MFRHKNNARLFERFFHEEVYIWKLSCLECDFPQCTCTDENMQGPVLSRGQRITHTTEKIAILFTENNEYGYNLEIGQYKYLSNSTHIDKGLTIICLCNYIRLKPWFNRNNSLYIRPYFGFNLTPAGYSQDRKIQFFVLYKTLPTLKLLSQLNLIQKFYSISNLRELVKTGYLPNSMINSFFPIKYKREISIHTLRKRSIIMYKSCNNDQHFGSREQNEKYFEDQDSILYI